MHGNDVTNKSAKYISLEKPRVNQFCNQYIEVLIIYLMDQLHTKLFDIGLLCQI